MTLSAAEIIRTLGLEPHPEGGHFRETWRDSGRDSGRDGDGTRRGHGTAIYFLLQAGERSHWHRVDAAEIWHFHAGAPLILRQSPDGTAQTQALLGPDLASGQRPQLIVPPFHWQAAESTGAWTLVGCTVSPAFQFENFELAPPGWQPGG